MNIELIDTPDRFLALGPEWNQLLAASSAESPFLRWEWLNAWWMHLAGPRGLAILAVRDGGELTAIAPFCVSHSLPWFARCEFLGTGFAGSDYLDVMALPEREARALSELAEYLRFRRLALRLDHLPVNSAAARLRPALTGNRWTARETEHGVCPFIRLSGHTWDSFLATIAPAHRATTRRRLRRLERSYAMRFERVRTETRRRDVIEALFAFHDQRWCDRGTAFQTESLRAFHRELTSRALDTDWLRLHALSLNGDLAGVMYGFAHKGRFYFYQHGYAPQYRSLGIGRALLDLTIRAAIDEGLSEFDLLYGDEVYKSAWTSEKRALIRLEFFPPHLRGRIQRNAIEAVGSMRAFARRVLSTYADAT
jgi:CelD/BcsL family acetyltransferase involved in cellulose biosynthesis